jgi:hypothetical protein
MTTRLRVHSDQKSKLTPDIARDCHRRIWIEPVAPLDRGVRDRAFRRPDRQILDRPVREAAGRGRCRVRISLPGGRSIKADSLSFIWQSGETADTLASLRYVRENGGKTVGIINVPTSSLARLTDAIAPTLAGQKLGWPRLRRSPANWPRSRRWRSRSARLAVRSTPTPKAPWSLNLCDAHRSFGSDLRPCATSTA